MSSIRTVLRSVSLITLLAGSLVACNQNQNSGPGPASSPATVPSPSVAPKSSATSFGAPISSKETVAIADLVRDPGAWTNKTVVISGTVSSVCQNMGCWMVIEDQGAQSMVRMKGHSFGVPKDSKGKRVRVEGQVNSSAANGPKHDCPHGGHGEHSDGGSHECQKATPQQVPFEAAGVEFI